MDTALPSLPALAPAETAAPVASVAPAPSTTPTAPDALAAPDAPAVPREPSLIEELVRDPARFLARIETGDGPALVRALLATVALGTGAFGAVVGSYRGGRQVLYCATKVPLVLLATLAICTPAFIAVARALGTRISPRGIVALTLGACARFALVLAGLAPVVWLAHGWLDYHDVVLAVVAAASAAGLVASALLFHGLANAGGFGRCAGLAIVCVFALVGGQTSWLLRPFLVRPRTESVPFVRAIEGDLLDSVRTSARSAAGVYHPRARDTDVDVQGPAPNATTDTPRETRECAEGASCD